ncbi:MAG: acetate--CoA ligase family protein, partial [Planctomycetota bacterium]|nr:acetate--CoA ligase family protein [Planctomycetota bacterium]
MDLMEYKAKELFERFDLPVSRGRVVESADRLECLEDWTEFPCVVKAQVQTGGRGKAGGIRVVRNAAELRQGCGDILGMDIKGHTVNSVLLAPCVDIKSEWYLSVALDRLGKGPVVIFSPVGGVDIEETAARDPDRVVKLAVDPLV